MSIPPQRLNAMRELDVYITLVYAYLTATIAKKEEVEIKLTHMVHLIVDIGHKIQMKHFIELHPVFELSIHPRYFSKTPSFPSTNPCLSFINLHKFNLASCEI